MKSGRLFCLVVLAFATVIMCGGCYVYLSGVISLLPTDAVANHFARKGVSTIYAYGYSDWYGLPIASVEPETSQGVTVIWMKDFNTAYGGHYRDGVSMAAEPCSTPDRMYLKEVRYRLDDRSWRSIGRNPNANDGHQWKFWVGNEHNGTHELVVQFRFVAPSESCAAVIREVHMYINMVPCG